LVIGSHKDSAGREKKKTEDSNEREAHENNLRISLSLL
jgi:hypothetical protein